MSPLRGEGDSRGSERGASRSDDLGRKVDGTGYHNSNPRTSAI